MRITTSGAANRNTYYDRNPTNITTAAEAAVGIAPHASTQRWAYTVPTGRKAIVGTAHARVERNVAAGTAGFVSAFIVSANVYWTYVEFALNVSGNSIIDRATGPIVMLAGQASAAFTADGSIGGTTNHEVDAAITEFDA